MYIRKDVCTKDCTDKVRKEIVRSTGTLLPNTYEMRFSLNGSRGGLGRWMMDVPVSLASAPAKPLREGFHLLDEIPSTFQLLSFFS